MANESKTESVDITENEEEEMNKKLATLAVKDKNAKMQKFVENADAIRDIKDQSSSDILQPNAYGNNERDDDAKQAQLDDKTRKEYFGTTAERRTRFQATLKKMDDLKFKLNKQTILELTVNNAKFRLNTTVTNAKCFRKEPTVWYLETIVPGTPQSFMKHWGQSVNRLKWDKTISHHQKVPLWSENNSRLYVINHQTQPAVGGLVSPRQFTMLVQRWEANNGVELAGQTIKYKDFPSQKGLVDASNNLYGQRITVIDKHELKQKYGIPELEVECEETMGKKETLTWSKCEYMIQTDIKGWLPTKVVESAVAGGCINTYDMCREYLLKDVYGLKVKIAKIQ